MSPVFYGTPEGVAEQNMIARIRGLILMAYSNKFGWLVLSSGNKSELSVGHCTLYGDMCGGLGVISDVPKTWVYKLANYINQKTPLIPESIITRAPVTGLSRGEKDSSHLPPYEVLDEILELYIEHQISGTDIVANHQFDENVVRWVQRKVDLNEWKRSQAPLGLKVTSKAFGMGRRVPIVQRFVD